MSKMQSFFDNVKFYENIEELNEEVFNLSNNAVRLTNRWWNDEYGFEENVKLQKQVENVLKKIMYYMAVCNKQKTGGMIPQSALYLLKVLVELSSHATIGNKSRQIIDWSNFLIKNICDYAYIEDLDDSTI